jgi:hypothetical protein
MATDGLVELAREAAVAESGESWVGEHLGATHGPDGLINEAFACAAQAYRGWHWAVVLAPPSGESGATVCEVVLLPGEEALVAPAWIPWSERVRPGDLGVGDVLPTPIDDPRLVPGFTGLDDREGAADDGPLHPETWELGLGRLRVLSLEGRDAATERWHDGDRGPHSAMAKAAELTCTSCGFLITIGGPLGQAFGVCANEMSPTDGAVGALDYGCGAHSQVEVAPPTDEASEDPIVDELGFDQVLPNDDVLPE